MHLQLVVVIYIFLTIKHACAVNKKISLRYIHIARTIELGVVNRLADSHGRTLHRGGREREGEGRRG
jgi:hypothetical protein